MNKLKLLTSSTLFAVTLALSQGSLSMDRSMDRPSSASDSLGVRHISSAQERSLDDSFKQSSFYHPFLIEQYRASIQNLRQDIMTMHTQVSLPELDEAIQAVQQAMSQITMNLNLHLEALENYGGEDRSYEKAREKIEKEIEELKRKKENAEQIIRNNPILKVVYDDEIKSIDEKLETYRKYLPALDKSEDDLKAEFDILDNYLRKQQHKSCSSDDIQRLITQKVEEVKGLYETYVRGLCSKNSFTHNLPKTVLESLAIPSSTHLDTEKLFPLFARTMELPSVVLQRGEEGEEAYKRQLQVIMQNLTNRLHEDVFAIQVGSSTAQGALFAPTAAEDEKDGQEEQRVPQSKKISLNFKSQGQLLERLVENPQNLPALSVLSEETILRELNIFKNILSAYGYQEEKPSRLLEAVIRQSPYGLLGLCIGALESHPITSWNDMTKIGLQTRIRDIKTPEELSARIIENVYNILGRHINKQVLQNILETLHQEPVVIPPVPVPGPRVKPCNF
ncbi:MAG: hypothetical protein K0R52_9 [Alphaproteobacteria bacterium]|jgi:hypothetical protein|nr:hypothetical protein [Alphaproteobacteria bacterium]